MGQIKKSMICLAHIRELKSWNQKTILKSAEAGASRDTTPEVYLPGEEAARAINLWEHLSGNLINFWRLNKD